MKLRQLQFAKTIAEIGSFSRAAEICNATQPTLSNALTQLEEELGGKLFTRTTRKVALTPFGSYLLPFLSAVLEGKEEMEKAAIAFHNPVHKLLRIGFSPLVDMKLLNRVIKPYRQRHPDISIFFKECFLDDLSQRLVNESIDIAIVPDSAMEVAIERTPFYTDPLLYLPQDNGPQKKSGESLRLSVLPDAPIILTGGGCGLNDAVKEMFEAQGVKLRTYPGQAMSYPVIEEWASLGIGAGILPKAKLIDVGQSVQEQKAIPLLLGDGSPASFTYNWNWSSSITAKAHIEDFIDYIQAVVPALVSGETSSIATRTKLSG